MDLGIGGRLAVITGAASGMGLETARILAAEGAKLILSDLDEASLGRAAADIGGECVTRVADLSSHGGAESLATLAREHGGCDILVHTAGITGEKGDPLEMSEKAWRDAWDTDFMSGVRVARTLVPQMVEKKRGRVVFITSENAVQPYPDEAVYNAAKAALLNFTKCLSLGYAERGVLVNAVSPAFIETPMTDGMMEQRAEEKGVSIEEAIESFLAEERPYLRLGRRGKVEEVAPIIAMLCSEHASFVTGAAWRVDGGAVGAMNL